MTLKRIRSLHDLLGDTNDHHHRDQSIAIANFLVFFSQVKDSSPSSYPKNINHQLMTNSFSGGRVFECKTCNRRFPSFQALGGHRASHKKQRSVVTTGAGLEADHPSPINSKSIHECSICGLEFPIGQALGGHMRRHRATSDNDHRGNHRLEQGGSCNGGESWKSPPRRAVQEVSGTARRPVVKRSSSGKRVVLSMDLNLTPFENGLEFWKLGQAAPTLNFM